MSSVTSCFRPCLKRSNIQDLGVHPSMVIFDRVLDSTRDTGLVAEATVLSIPPFVPCFPTKFDPHACVPPICMTPCALICTLVRLTLSPTPYTRYPVRCTLGRFTLNPVLCTLYPVLFTLYLHPALVPCNMCPLPCSLYRVPLTLYPVPIPVPFPCTLYPIPYTLCVYPVP